MGEEARRVVLQKFSCEAQLKRTLSLYEELLAGTRKATFDATVEDVHRKGV
jgi:hypothetical protein